MYFNSFITSDMTDIVADKIFKFISLNQNKFQTKSHGNTSP